MPLVPDYAPVTGPRIARGLYGWVLFCAIAPMVVGTAILAAYLITRSKTTLIAGFMFFGVGAVLLLIDAGLLAWYWAEQRRSNLLSPAELRRRVRLGRWLLIANLAAATAGSYIASREFNRKFYVLTNTSSLRIDAATLRLPDGEMINFGSVGPNQTVKRSAIYDPRLAGITSELTVTSGGATFDGGLCDFEPMGGIHGSTFDITFDGKGVRVK